MSRLLLLAEDNPTDEKLTLRAFKKSGLVQQVVVVRDGPEVLDFLFATGAFESRAALARATADMSIQAGFQSLRVTRDSDSSASMSWPIFSALERISRRASWPSGSRRSS